MLKHFDSSLSFINNETKFALYIEIAKPLILTLPDINDKVKAIAWFKKIIFDNTSLLLRIEYLELFLKFLKHRKLSGFFAGLPDTRRPLQKFKKRIKIQPLLRHGSEINHFTEAPPENVDSHGDNYLIQKNTCNIHRCKYMEVHPHINKEEHNTQCFKKNNRISAGYSPFTKKEIQHEIRNIMNLPGDENEKINKCKAMLTFNCLPPTKTSDENSMSPVHGKKGKYIDLYNVTTDYENFNPMSQNIFCKRKNNRTVCEYKYPADEKLYQHVHGKNNKTMENVAIKAKLKDENKESKGLDQYCGTNKDCKLESFLEGSKKYLTLCVSKECLVERNILKCVKYIISNAQCKFFKFKEYPNSDKKCSTTKPRKTYDISNKHRTNSFLNYEPRAKKRSSSIYICGCTPPENNHTLFFNNSYLTHLRNLLNDNVTFANICDTLRNMIGNCIYIKISLILAMGTIFFWKIYQIIFAYQCKKMGYSTQLVSQISNYRNSACSPYVFTFVGCFILYQIVKDFINIFLES